MASPQGGSTAGFGRIRSYRPNKTRVRPPFPGTFSSRPLFLRAAQCHMGGMSDEKPRSEEHTSELQSLMRISYAVFCLKKKTNLKNLTHNNFTIHTHVKPKQLIYCSEQRTRH